MSNSTRLLLIRHAEVEARYQHVFGGSVDMDISPRGHEQAAALAGFLRTRPFDALYASLTDQQKRTADKLFNSAPSSGGPQGEGAAFRAGAGLRGVQRAPGLPASPPTQRPLW